MRRAHIDKKIACAAVLVLAAVAASLAVLVPGGQSSSSQWPFSVSAATLQQAGIRLTQATTPDPGTGASAQASAAQLFGVPASAASYMHCQDTLVKPNIDQDCYVVQFDASKFTLPSQQSGKGAERLSWFVGFVDPTSGDVIETRGAG